MKNQVNFLKELGFIDNNFVSVDATPVKANTKFNNPKCFSNNKFSKKNPPTSDKDCKLGVRTANNSMNIKVSEDKPNKSKKNYDFYWGYKNHIICDAISGLPISEFTTTADINEISTLIQILTDTNEWFSLNGSYIIADKGYDSKQNHDFIRNTLKGHAFIALNKRGTKKNKLTFKGNIICDGGLAMHKDGKQYFDSYIKQKFCCPYRKSKIIHYTISILKIKKQRLYQNISINTNYIPSINLKFIFKETLL